jgi:hypothetical protein
VFATLVPRGRWPALVPLLVAVQVMYDYLDTLGEEPVAAPLRNGRQLHAAIAAALNADLPTRDYYAHHPQSDETAISMRWSHGGARHCPRSRLARWHCRTRAAQPLVAAKGRTTRTVSPLTATTTGWRDGPHSTIALPDTTDGSSQQDRCPASASMHCLPPRLIQP